MDVFITIQKAYYPLLCALGIPANLFTFYMVCFRKCGMSVTAIVYLGSLTIIDTFYVLWVILLDLTLTFLQQKPFWHSHPWCSILTFLQFGSLYSSSWIVVAFTIERYLVLSSTYASRWRQTHTTAVLTCVTIVLLSHLASIPLCWINAVVSINITMPDGVNISGPRCLYMEGPYSTTVVWVTTFLSSGLPIFLVVLFNSLIVSHVVQAHRLFTKEELRAMKVSGRNSAGGVQRSVLLLGTVSAAFVAFSMPRFVTYCVLRTVYNREDFNRNDYGLPINVASDLANMLQNLSSTTNFLLYCVVSRQFRHELVHLLSCGSRIRQVGSAFTQSTMKVFSVADHRSTTSRDPVNIVLTKLPKQTEFG
nr:probable G-protein coupled receptor 139 [Paramormyrops kingsleyae]